MKPGGAGAHGHYDGWPTSPLRTVAYEVLARVGGRLMEGYLRESCGEVLRPYGQR